MTTVSASAPWLTRPIFISSTFKDMQAERDYLRQIVFPRLDEVLREERLRLEPIDLRLGVETVERQSEAARELLVLKVGLEEIHRSRPFLIVLLGDRYGWVPPGERMAAASQEAGFDKDLRDKSVTALIARRPCAAWDVGVSAGLGVRGRIGQAGWGQFKNSATSKLTLWVMSRN